MVAVLASYGDRGDRGCMLVYEGTRVTSAHFVLGLALDTHLSFSNVSGLSSVGWQPRFEMQVCKPSLRIIDFPC